MIFTPGLGRTLSSKALSIAFAIGGLASASFAQQAKVHAPHRPIPPRVPKSQELPLPPGRLGSVVGGPWMTDANFKSTIHIKNVVEVYAITVTPILYLSNGARYALPAVNLEPAGTAIVDINAALDSLGIASFATLSGYVELQYNWPWLPICAFIRNVDTAHSLIFMEGIEVLSPELLADQEASASHRAPQKQQTIEGLWWKQEAGVTGFVSLINTSAQPISAKVQTNDGAGRAFASHSTTISAHGTKIVNMPELLLATGTEGGVRITYTGMQGALYVSGGLEDTSVGYSAAIHLLPVDPAAKTARIGVSELGLMVGPADPMMLFPAGTKFTPFSVVRNISSLPATVTPTLWWMQGGSAHSFGLPSISLPAFHSQSLNVAAMLSSAGLKTFNGSFNIVFDTESAQNGLLFSAGSVDQSNTYVFEVIPRGIGESVGKSLTYWSTGNGDDTMMTFWNPADESQDLVFKLFFSGGHYSFPVHLDARTTRNLNVSEIIQSQVPDADGNIIPASVRDGSAEILGSQADNQDILVAFDSAIYNVRKAICGAPNCITCNGATTAPSGVAVTANPFSVAVGGQTQLKFTLTWSTGTQYDDTGSATWSSSNTSVATVQTGLTKGISVGSPKITANYMQAAQAKCLLRGHSTVPVHE